jgi:TolB-like protein/DNA-binding winged helix-turn-helix (wHTH) protein/Tfp pilus assembly protein PilF
VNAAFRFGRFELDGRARELRKDGVRLRLQGQPFEVLQRLLQRPGDMITREELRQQLWPEGTFVDFEHGLNAAVKRLRAALGDDAERPRFVETLPRRGYRFIGTVERAGLDDLPHLSGFPEGRGGNGNAPQKRRLAVLPFTSLSGDATQEYFADGLREEMITQLGRLCAGRLGIIARTSSTLIQRTATRIRDIGDALRADYVVEGNVRRDGDRARITVQLIESRGETQLWAESYERHLSDCFQVQSEVATEIVHSLAVELLPVAAHAPQPGTRHVDAHQAYLKGRYHWNKPADQGIREAIAFFQQAVDLDGQFACAYAALGRAQVGAVNYLVLEPRATLENARRAATRALQLDPTESEAHLTLAEVERILEWDWSGAEKGYRTALAFNPSSVAVHRHYGLYLAARRRVAEASAATERAYDLDPLCLEVNTNAAWVRFVARDYPPAIERCRHTLDMDPGYVNARRLLAAALMEAGRIDEASAELEWLAADHIDPVSLAWLAHGFATKGDRARASGMLEQIERLAHERYVSAYHRAHPHLALDDREGALSLLALASEQRDPAIINLAVDPRFDGLASDRRYQALIGSLALPA